MSGTKFNRINFTLHPPLWSRIKLLFGWGLRVEIEADERCNIHASILVEGETGSNLLSVGT